MEVSMKLFETGSAVLALTVALAAPAMSATGKAKIMGTAEGSKIAGDLAVSDSPKGLTITGDISGLTPGQHGFHVHEFGDCSDSGKAAGSHYNPMNHPHGNSMKDASKAHAGDMGNLEADAQGMAHVNLTLPGVMLNSGKVTAAGRAVVVHEKADDFGQPVGNAGGRVGCGPIVVTGN
jgi:superoxide dismutase, Cu-Zn family